VPQFSVLPFAKIRDAADSSDGYYALGRSLQYAGKFDDAERAYRQALDIDPEHINARNGLAVVSAGRGDLDSAIAILDSMVALHPDQPYLLANLGYAHYLKGNYFNARVALEQATSLDPNNLKTREKLTRVLDKFDTAVSDEPVLSAEAERISAVPPADTRPMLVVTATAPGIYKIEFGRRSPAPASIQAESKTQAEVSATQLMPAPEQLTGGKLAQVEIVNGNGVPGQARLLRSLIQGSEWQVVRLANHVRFDVMATRIEYAHGNRKTAEYLAQGLKLEPVYWYNDTLGDRVRVVLGHNGVRSALSRPWTESHVGPLEVQFTATGATVLASFQTTSLSIE
jgi:tetratricopeptide (TPR) repeat protein